MTIEKLNANRLLKKKFFTFSSLFLIPMLLLVMVSGFSERASAAGNLTVRILAGYNLVVDSNVLSPSTYAPSVATVAGEFCNIGGTTLTNVEGFIGDYQGSLPASTPGIYPARAVDAAFIAEHPHLSQGIPSDFYAFEHVGGRIGLNDATRFIGDIPAGECRMQYWHFSYPRRSNPNNTGPEPVWGLTRDPNDDLWLEFDVWGSAPGGHNDNATWRMTTRNEISAMANKIQPNPNGRWFNTNTNTIRPGDTITSNGILYELGNVNQGFDNDGDFVPDYNAWVQPIGDPDYDPSCFRLIRTSGTITVSRSGGNPDLAIPFTDQLYFTNLPPNNTGVRGEVFYTFLALNGPCATGLSPYQEVASGSDNEKFNGDFGAGIPPVASAAPEVSLAKSGSVTATTSAPNNVITYSLVVNNFSADLDAGLPFYNMNLVLSDTIPVSTTYVAGSASATVAATIRYSVDGGQTYTTTEPVPASDVTTLLWWFDDTLAASSSATANFSVQVSPVYNPSTGSPAFAENCSAVSFGGGVPFAEDCASTLIEGNNSIGDTVWRDENGNAIQDSESGLANITVWLYVDQNGDGALDSGDTLVATKVTDGSGNYLFDNLPDAEFLVVVDIDDPQLPFGYNTTTPDFYAVDLNDPGDINYTDADFGFGPVLTVEKEILTVPAYEGHQVVYTIDLINNRVGDGTGVPAACQHTIWATIDHPDNVNTPPGGNGANAQWANTVEALGASDGVYATTDMNDNSDLLGLSGFNLGAQQGNITGVSVVLYVQEIANFKAADIFTMRVFHTDTQIGADFDYAGDTFFTGGAGTNYVITQDVTGLRAWDWPDFLSNLSELQVEGDKGGGAGSSGDIGLDAAAFVITTDQTCGGSSDTIDPLPLSDTYDADRLQFVSAVPAQTSVATGGVSPYANTGTISWADLGPLYAGGIQVVTVTFEALTIPSNLPTVITNTATVTNAEFLNGRPVHGAEDDEVTTLQPTGSIGDLVWSDANGDTFSTGEQGIPGVVVTLTADVTITVDGVVYPPGTAVTTTTDATGNYLFDGLLDGNYVVTVDVSSIPGSTVVQTFDNDGLGTPDESSRTIAGASDNLNEDFGYTIPNTVFGNVWQDFDGDGTRDAGDSGMGGVVITATDGIGGVFTTITNPDGSYVITDLPNGTYTILVDSNTLPNGGAGSSWGQTFDPDEGGLCAICDDQTNTNSVSLTGGTVAGPFDFGYTQSGIYSISGTIYGDWDSNSDLGSGDEGFGGVTVNLLSPTGEVISTTTTNPDGSYTFNNLPNGDYSVDVDETTLPAQYTPTEVAGPVTIADAPVTDVDYGYEPAGTGTIGDFVWQDRDGDGVQDSGESGIGNVLVTLYSDADGDGTYTAVLMTTTNGSGLYSFEDLPPGDYRVVVDAADNDLPADSVPSTPISVDVTLTAGQSYLDADFGFTGAGSIGDTIYWDANNNGVEDWDETGIPGVDVQLTNATTVTIQGVVYLPGAYITTTTTDANGQYLFTGLPAGDYAVAVQTGTLPGSPALTGDPDAYSLPCTNVPTPTDCDDAIDVSLPLGRSFLGGDFGYLPSGVIGDYVWRDLDGDGIQDAGEPGISGVVITVTSGSGTFTTTTDFDGLYSFSNLPDDTWTVIFEQPANMVATVINNTAVVSGTGSVGATATVVIAGGAVTTVNGNACAGCGLHIDSGFVLNGPYNLSGTVFFDADDDGGLYSGVTDSPYSNITIFLYDSNNSLIGSTTTDANGFYQFSNLPNGDYTVSLNNNSQQLANLTMTAAPDELPAKCTVCNNFAPVTINNADEPDQDFGFFAGVDFGDLPATYDVTKLADGGPYHITSGLLLGANIDTEGDGDDSSAIAMADNFDDGVLRAGTPWFPLNTVNLSILVTGGSGRVAGWLDWNNDGDFLDANEFYDFGTISGVQLVPVTVPAGYVPGTPIHSRFRVFDPTAIPGGTLDAGDFIGSAVGGEVEDYYWNFSVTAVSMKAVNALTTASPTAPILVLLGILLLILISIGLYYNYRRIIE